MATKETGALLDSERGEPSTFRGTGRLRPPRGLGLIAASSAVLVPWTVVLALTLPVDREVHQWRAAWTGFDVLLVVLLAATAILGRRRHPAGLLLAVASAVLLVCDAWFDVSLDMGTADVWLSGALAVSVELPLAAFLILRVYRVLAASLLRTPDDAPPGWPDAGNLDSDDHALAQLPTPDFATTTNASTRATPGPTIRMSW